jgi:hypothetical protein
MKRRTARRPPFHFPWVEVAKSSSNQSNPAVPVIIFAGHMYTHPQQFLVLS